jgi:hypothetical protein
MKVMKRPRLYYKLRFHAEEQRWQRELIDLRPPALSASKLKLHKKHLPHHGQVFLKKVSL